MVNMVHRCTDTVARIKEKTGISKPSQLAKDQFATNPKFCPVILA